MSPPPSDQFPQIPAAPTPEERAEWQQEFTPSEQDALGLRSVLSNGVLFCGVRVEDFAIGGVTHGFRPASKLKWGLTFSRLGQLTANDCKDAITAAFKEVSDNADVSFEYTSSADFANLYLTSVRLDGPSGVLADCEIPPPKASPSNTRLRMRFDDTEAWVMSDTPQRGQIDFYRVFLHEALHFCGLGHKPTNVSGEALIAPSYSARIRNLQALDISELQRRYGKPDTVVPPPETTPIGGMVLQGACGDQTVKVAVEFPSARTVSARIDVTKGKLKTTLSGTKPMAE